VPGFEPGCQITACKTKKTKQEKPILMLTKNGLWEKDTQNSCNNKDKLNSSKRYGSDLLP
jgi:hypothetical protein